MAPGLPNHAGFHVGNTPLPPIWALGYHQSRWGYRSHADLEALARSFAEHEFPAWVKAGFLFPFFRNHTMRGSRSQEPWAYSENALKITRHFVRLRYHLLPYLYNLFMDQEEAGAAVLRPLFYDFQDSDEFPIGKIDDQFMVGPAILQAPFVDEKRIGIFCSLSKNYGGECRYRYRADDGVSFDYRKGGRSELEIAARVEKNRLKVKVSEMGKGFGRIELTFYTVHRFSEIVIERDGAEHILQPFEEGVRMTGNLMKWYRWTLPLP